MWAQHGLQPGTTGFFGKPYQESLEIFARRTRRPTQEWKEVLQVILLEYSRAAVVADDGGGTVTPVAGEHRTLAGQSLLGG